MRGGIGDTRDDSVLVESTNEASRSSPLTRPSDERHARNGADPLAALSDELEERQATDPAPALSLELDEANPPVRPAAATANGSLAEPVAPPAHRGADRGRLQIVSAAMLALACAAAAVVTVRAFVAASGDDFPGVIQPSQTISLDFSEGGYLSSVSVHPGDHVRPGEILARMNPVGAHALKLAGQAADAAVAADEQQLTVAQHAVTGVPAVRLATVRRARAQLAADQARVAQVKAMLDQGVIRSPVDGVVTDVSGAVGELVGPTGVQTDGTDQSSQLAQTPSVSLFSQAFRHPAAAARNAASTLIQLAAGPTEMGAQVPESAVRGMRTGRQATVTVPALGARFSARLLRVVPDPVQANGDVSYEVLFVVQRPSPRILPGMSADVTLGR